MIRVTGNNSLLMSSLNTDTDNDTKVVDLLKKSSETEKSSKTTGKKSEEYDSVKKSASSLKASATVLSETGEDSIFAKAEESGDYSDLISLIERFTGDYNSLLELKSIISGQSEALQKVGITVDSNGKLVVDEDTLKNADKKELKELFQGEKSIAGKVADKSIYIGANAAADQYVDSCANYTAGGTSAEYVQMANLIGSYLDSLS